MYLGIDIGGTKTLAAVLDDNANIVEQTKFLTSKNYDEFLQKLQATVASFTTKEFHAAGVAFPGRLDREHGMVVRCGNLDWINIPAMTDLQKLLDCPIVIENDAKMAALSEALLLKSSYQKVLYITISTGIGTALVVGGAIDTSFGDAGGNALVVEHEGKLEKWESFASGKAILTRYGKMAKDIEDEAIWKQIAHDFSLGLLELLAMVEPEIVVFGGSVGTYFDKFSASLEAELEKHETPMLPIPPLVQAKHPEEAVIYGAYELARQTYGKTAQPA